MIKKVISLIFILFILTGCSFKSVENQWEFNSAKSFESYKKNFLSGEFLIAKGDLQSSISYAKRSANLNQLGRIYLGKCALNISIGNEDTCKEFFEIKDLINSNELNSYYMMLNDKLPKENVEFLPKKYQNFYISKLEKDYDKSFESIKNEENISSLFIATSLIKNKLSKNQINYLIDKASFHGYKALVLFWLKQLHKKELDENEKKKILKKIKIIEN